jgi:hypothetical protein
MTTEFKLPTEMVELPSKGLVYPADSPLRSGFIEMKYMSAKEEDILTNMNLIESGKVLDKLLESLTLNKINVKELVVGDKNAIFVASRILGYGKDYKFTYDGEEQVVDLTKLKSKYLNPDLVDEQGHFTFQLPTSNNVVKFKLLNEIDENNIDTEVESMKKFGGGGSITTRLKHMIVSVNGDSDKNTIKSFVENYLLAKDSQALREYVSQVSPDIDMSYTLDSGEDIKIPISINFIFPPTLTI